MIGNNLCKRFNTKGKDATLLVAGYISPSPDSNLGTSAVLHDMGSQSFKTLSYQADFPRFRRNFDDLNIFNTFLYK